VVTLASDRVARRERNYALQQRELATSSARTMISNLASTLQNLSAPIERRLRTLQEAVEIFDRIDSTDREGLDPGQRPIQLRTEIQTDLTLTRALEDLGDPKAAIHRAEMAEARAKKLLAAEGSNAENQLLMANALLEKSRALSKAGDAATATAALEQALYQLRALDHADLDVNIRRSLEVVLCQALISKASASDELINPGETNHLITEAIANGERAYNAQPSEPEVVDSYAKSLEELGRFYFNSGNPELFQEPVKKALALRKNAAGKNPDNTALQRGSERAIADWGCLLAYFDPSGENIAQAAESVAVLQRLREADPDNIDLAEELLRNLRNYGSFFGDRQQYQDAVKVFEETISLGKSLLRKGKDSLSIKYSIGEAAFDVFESYSKLGDFESAKRVAAEVVAPLAQEFETRKLDTPIDHWMKPVLTLSKER
jgi:tetratricopeptide (TPR) repeat protein